MKHYVGLDVAVEMTAICIMDATGKVQFETFVPTDPDAIANTLRDWGADPKLIGLEAGSLSQWLYFGLNKHWACVVCLEVKRMRIYASASSVKTDRIDARAIADALRVGAYRAVHVKSPQNQRVLVLLNHRRALLEHARDLERMIRGTIRLFGLKVGRASSLRFEPRVLELLADHPDLVPIVRPVLVARRFLLRKHQVLDRLAEKLARSDKDVCRLMTMPGVGPITALMFKATLDAPARFRRSQAVGVYMGLTPRLHESGETSWRGGITKSGDKKLRRALYAAAQVHLTRSYQPSWLRDWALRVAERRGVKRAIIALARRMAVVLHRMLLDSTPYHPERTSIQLLSGASMAGSSSA